MANYSVNQNRQFYLATSLSEDTHVSTVTEASSAKAIGVNGITENSVKQFMYFVYKGADTVLRSDMIPVANISSIRLIKGADMATKMRKVSVKLNASINSGAPVAGQDYVLGINFKNFFSSGDASQYYKDASVHASSSVNTASLFYKAMVHALNMAFSREDGATATSNPYLRFAIGYSTSSESEEGDGNWAGATATKIIIEEKPQAWALGTKKARRIMFDILPSTIYTGGEDVIWAAQEATGYYYKEETPSTTVKNGQKIADLEWFCMGERGDQYRNVGWPNVIPTTYFADPTASYSTIEIHYAFTDSGVNSYRSEKEITIAVPDGSVGHVYDVINDIKDEIATHTGLTIADLSE